MNVTKLRIEFLKPLGKEEDSRSMGLYSVASPVSCKAGERREVRLYRKFFRRLNIVLDNLGRPQRQYRSMLLPSPLQQT